MQVLSRYLAHLHGILRYKNVQKSLQIKNIIKNQREYSENVLP